MTNIRSMSRKISSGASKKAAYRPEIDGLRAFAVSAVIVNHFNRELLPGGYLGVDIFFVISGYVISSSLYGRKSISLKDFIGGFYERRIRRLVPALSLFVLIAGIAICLFNPVPDLSLQTGIAALFGLSNMYLLKQSTDYFAQSTELNVFTHTWSLGVEEQFYILFPFLIWFSGFARQAQHGARNLFLVVGGLAIASLISFLYFYPINQSATYFLMPTRFWEMAAGCLIFIGFKKRASIEQLLERVPPLLVLASIIGAMYAPLSFAPASTLVVVLLAAILIACLKKKTLLFGIFANRLIVHIGLMSYSLYLWHWGVLSISRWTIGIHWWSVPFQILLILILSQLSYRWIETPIRRSNYCVHFAGGRKAVAFCGGSFLIATALALGVLGKNSIYSGTERISPPTMEPLDASAQSQERRIECTTELKAPVSLPSQACYKNRGKETPLIVLVGDSMSNSLYKIVDIEDKAGKSSTFFSSRNSCIFPQPEISQNNCAKWSEMMAKFVIKASKNHSATILVINGFYQSYFDESRSLFQPFLGTTNDYQGYLKATAKLADSALGHNITLLISMPVPVQGFSPYPECFREWFRPGLEAKCKDGTKVELTNFNPRGIRERFAELAIVRRNVLLLDPLKVFCGREFCRVLGPAGEWLYADDHHLSYQGASYMYPEFLRKKDLILGRIE